MDPTAPRGAPSKMTQNGLKWLFSVIFRKRIRVRLTRLQMASPGAYLGSLGCVRPQNTSGCPFPIVCTDRGYFQRCKTRIFSIFWWSNSAFENSLTNDILSENLSFCLKKARFFVKSENHPMYTSLQMFFLAVFEAADPR